MVSLMKNALIISKTETSIKAVASLLEDERFSRVQCTLSTEDAKRKLRDNSYELIIINAPLNGENGLEFSVYCAEHTKACVILIAAREKSLDVFDFIGNKGVLVCSKPLNRRLFKNLIEYSLAYKRRITDSEMETEKLKNELEEIKIINRAKLLLIQCLSMTETQAHRYIEKQAMNMRTSKLSIAKQVIRTYQN